MTSKEVVHEFDWSLRDEPEVRNAIAARYMDAVKLMALRKWKSVPSQVDLSDVESAAMEGLAKAITDFNAELSIPFGRYLSFRIQGHMLDELRAADHLGRNARIALKARAAAVARLSQQLGRSPTEQEIDDELGEPIQTRGNHILSHDALVDMFDKNIKPQCRRKMSPQRFDSFRDALKHESFDVQILIYLYYVKNARLHEIATAMGISESRASQLLTRTMQLLREKNRDQLIDALTDQAG